MKCLRSTRNWRIVHRSVIKLSSNITRENNEICEGEAERSTEIGMVLLSSMEVGCLTEFHLPESRGGR